MKAKTKTAKSKKAPKEASSLIGKIRDDARKTGNASWVEQRTKLLAAAADAIREKGLEKVTMADIAARSGGDRASIYYYFSSKHEIYVALVEDTLMPLVEATEKIADRDDGPMDKLRAIFEMWMDANERHFPYLYLYTQEDMRRLPPDAPRAKELKELGERTVAVLRRITREGHRTGEFRTNLDAELILLMMHGAVSWTHRWFVPGGQWSGAEVGRAFSEIFAHGIVAPKRK